MKSWKHLQIALAWLACCGFLWPAACGAEPTNFLQAPPVKTLDVELTQDGALQGTLVTATGGGLADAPVFLSRGSQLVARAATNERGEFSLPSVRGGNYQLVAGGRVSHVRVWAHRTAPPQSASAALLVAGQVQRGQCTTESCTGSCGGLCAGGGGAGGLAGGPLGLLMNPLVVGAAIAAAIAIPLALDDDDAS